MFSAAIVLALALHTNFAYGEVVYGCEGTTLNISCLFTFQTIEIHHANYGRTSSKICKKAGLDSNKNCKSTNATAIMSQRCENHDFCSVNVTNEVFQDPCVGTYKYLEVNYTCQENLGHGPVIILTCATNEQAGCVNPCNAKCQDSSKKRVRTCSTLCKYGCVCKTGYIKDTLSGMCVGDKYCPLPGSPCDTHEKFSDCDAACQPTCKDRKPKKCTESVPGYVCDDRYLRDSTTGQCVLPKQCPKK